MRRIQRIHNRQYSIMFETKVNDSNSFQIGLEDGTFTLNGSLAEVDIAQLSEEGSFQVLYAGGSYTVHVVQIDREAKQVQLVINGKTANVALSTELDRLLKSMGLENAIGAKVSEIKAPMPGLIHSIEVKEGDEVSRGDPVLILEAMKMENVIKSPTDGKVAKVHVKQGANVDKNAVMISFA